jgi:hypothetical protein
MNHFPGNEAVGPDEMRGACERSGTPMARTFEATGAQIKEEAVAVAQFNHDTRAGLVADLVPNAFQRT